MDTVERMLSFLRFGPGLGAARQSLVGLQLGSALCLAGRTRTQIHQTMIGFRIQK